MCSSSSDEQLQADASVLKGIDRHLDDLEDQIGAIASGLTPAGAWDASTGVFPANAARGSFYIVSRAGTADGEMFAVGDWLLPLRPSPSPDVFAGNWMRADYSRILPRQYDDVRALIDSTEPGRGKGAVWEVKDGHRYVEAGPDDPDPHLTIGTDHARTRLFAQPTPALRLIDIRALGAVPGSDCSDAIRAADEIASRTGGIVVFPPLQGGFWRIGSTVEKRDNTLWRGAGPASYHPDPGRIGMGSAIYADFPGVAIRVRPGGATTYNRMAGFNGLLIFGNEQNPRGRGISYEISGKPGAARGHCFEDLVLAGFALSNLNIAGGGEYEFRRVYSARSEKCISGHFADSWFIGINHFGSGKEFANPNGAVCHGGFFTHLRNITSVGTRWQECLGGTGLHIEDCQNCSFDDIWDGNAAGGASIANFRRLTLRGRAFRNGNARDGGFGLELGAGRWDVSDGATITLAAFDEDHDAHQAVQTTGIRLSGPGRLRNIELLGCDLTATRVPLELSAETEGLRITGGQGIRPPFAVAADADGEWRIATDAPLVRLAERLSQDRWFRLRGAAVPDGFELRLVRAAGTGTPAWRILQNDGQTQIRAMAAGEWLSLAWIDGEWAPTGAGQI